MFKRGIRRNLRWFAVIVALMVAGIACSIYILIHERFPLPFESSYALNAEFQTADSALGGEGLPVTVAGVQVGTIRNVTARGGYARVQMALDPHTLPHVYANATAELVPDTPLKDMEVRIGPGGPPAKPLPAGGTIPLASTQSPIDLDQLTAALDTDSRDYLTSLLSGAAIGLQGRGLDVRQMLRALGPTTTQLRQLGDALAGRRHELARAVHNLALVAAAAGAKTGQIEQVVSAGDQTLHALATQDSALRRSLTSLPGTLATARVTLGHLTGFADLLGPTLTALEPTVHKLPAALRALGPLARQAVPIVRHKLRPLVHGLEPVAKNLSPTVHDLTAQTPDLIGAMQTLHYVTNETGYQSSSWPGFLFWTAWAAHNADSILSVDDANGATTKVLLTASCATLDSQPVIGVLLQTLLHISPTCN